MTARPGVTPVFFFRVSTRSRHSCRMLAATSLPSMTLATTKYLLKSDVGRRLPYEGANNNINDLAASEKSVQVCRGPRFAPARLRCVVGVAARIEPVLFTV